MGKHSRFETTNQKPFKSPYLTICVEDSILTGTYAKGLTIDIEMAKQIVRERLTYFNDRDYLSLVDARQIKFVTREARNYFANEGTNGLIALAIVVGKPLNGDYGKLVYESK